MIYNFFNKQWEESAIETGVTELHELIVTKFQKRKVYSSYIYNNIWGADLDMDY